MRKLLVALPILIGLSALLPWGYFLGTTKSVPGDPTRFDPVARLSEMADFACEGCELVELTAYGVSADGTVNISASYEPRVDYEFEGSPRADVSGPVGTGGPEVNYYGVSLGQPGMRGSGSHVGYSNFLSFGMDREESSRTQNSGSRAIATPCAFKQLWEHALTEGAPGEAVAWIKYSRRGYEFKIRGTDHRYKFEMDCKPVEKKKKSRGRRGRR
jgi:hypothetical protein